MLSETVSSEEFETPRPLKLEVFLVPFAKKRNGSVLPHTAFGIVEGQQA